MFIAAPSFQMFTPKFLPREFTSEQCDTAYMVRRLAFPAPPPPNGMVWQGWGGGGGLAYAESGLAGWPWVTERAGILRKPYASHKPYNVGRVPVLINLNLYLIL